MFTGEYRHSVDAKGRLAVPAKFRAQLESGAFVSRWLDPCLAIWPRAEWDGLASKIGSLPLIDNAGARKFSRYLFSAAAEVVWDAQGRFVLPAYLREQIGLGAEAVIVGALTHAEIWTPGEWDGYRREFDAPGELERQVRGLGI